MDLLPSLWLAIAGIALYFGIGKGRKKHRGDRNEYNHGWCFLLLFKEQFRARLQKHCELPLTVRKVRSIDAAWRNQNARYIIRTKQDKHGNIYYHVEGGKGDQYSWDILRKLEQDAFIGGEEEGKTWWASWVTNPFAQQMNGHDSTLWDGISTMAKLALAGPRAGFTFATKVLSGAPASELQPANVDVTTKHKDEGFCYLNLFKLEMRHHYSQELKQEATPLTLSETVCGDWNSSDNLIVEQVKGRPGFLHVREKEHDEQPPRYKAWTVIRVLAQFEPTRDWKVGGSVSGDVNFRNRILGQPERATGDINLLVPLFRKEHWDAVIDQLDDNPALDRLLGVPKSWRADPTGAVTCYRSDPNRLHLALGVNHSHAAWEQLTRLQRTKSQARVVPASAMTDLRLKWRETWNDIVCFPWKTYWFFMLVATALLASLYQSPSLVSVWILVTLLTPFVSWLCLPYLSPVKLPAPVTWTLGPAGRFVEFLANVLALSVSKSWSRLCVYLLGCLVPVIKCILNCINYAQRIKKWGRMIHNIIYLCLVWLYDCCMDIGSRRQYQAAGDQRMIASWTQNILQWLASTLQLFAMINPKQSTSSTLKRLARACKTFSHAANIPEALADLASILTTGKTQREDGGHKASAQRKVDSDQDMCDDEFTFKDRLCPHELNADNLDEYFDHLNDCPKGSIDVISAATGFGKSTKVPHGICKTTGQQVLVTIPTIKAVRSSGSVIEAIYGPEEAPTIHCGGSRQPGPSGVTLLTGMTLIGQTVFNPDWIRKGNVGTLFFDEIHVACLENFLFRRFSPKLTDDLGMKICWSSATHENGGRHATGGTQHPIRRIKHKTVQADKIFTSACAVPELRPDGMYGRHLVFCRSENECKAIAKRARSLGHSAHAIYGQALGSAQEEMEKDVLSLGMEQLSPDYKDKVIVVAATNCLQVGITLPWEFVSSFGEHMVPLRTIDPPQLSLVVEKISEGDEKQQAGRGSRLFPSTFFSPLIEYSKPRELTDADTSRATHMAQLFGMPYSAKGMDVVADKQLTDAFIENVWYSRLDPYAVALMTTEDGRFYKSFRKFEFPEGIKAASLHWSNQYLEPSANEAWHSHPVEVPAETDDEASRNGKQHSKQSTRNVFVKAPFWDYTARDQAREVLNWTERVVLSTNDGKGSDPKPEFRIRDRIQRSVWWCGNPSANGRVFQSASGSASDDSKDQFLPTPTTPTTATSTDASHIDNNDDVANEANSPQADDDEHDDQSLQDTLDLIDPERSWWLRVRSSPRAKGVHKLIRENSFTLIIVCAVLGLALAAFAWPHLGQAWKHLLRQAGLYDREGEKSQMDHDQERQNQLDDQMAKFNSGASSDEASRLRKSRPLHPQRRSLEKAAELYDKNAPPFRPWESNEEYLEIDMDDIMNMPGHSRAKGGKRNAMKRMIGMGVDQDFRLDQYDWGRNGGWADEVEEEIEADLDRAMQEDRYYEAGNNPIKTQAVINTEKIVAALKPVVGRMLESATPVRDPHYSLVETMYSLVALSNPRADLTCTEGFAVVYGNHLITLSHIVEACQKSKEGANTDLSVRATGISGTASFKPVVVYRHGEMLILERPAHIPRSPKPLIPCKPKDGEQAALVRFDPVGMGRALGDPATHIAFSVHQQDGPNALPKPSAISTVGPSDSPWWFHSVATKHGVSDIQKFSSSLERGNGLS